MLNSGILELAIGLIFVYLILGLMCTSANEWISNALRWRAKTLECGIRLLLAGGFHRLQTADLKDFPGFAARLTTGAGPLAGYLRSRLSPQTIEKLAACRGALPPPTEVAEALVSELNEVIEGACIHDEQRFAGVALARPTRALARSMPQGEQCARANRALIEEAFPAEIGGPADRFYRHPLIKSLAPYGRHPSYVPSRTFALALIDIVTSENPEAAGCAAELRRQIGRLPDGELKKSLTTVLRDTGGSIVEARRAVETWFDDSMDRVSGWYKRKTQWTIAVLAVAVTITTNADTIRIAATLWRAPAVRAELVARAEATALRGQPDRPAGAHDRESLEQLIGWGDEWNTLGAGWRHGGLRGWFEALWSLAATHFVGWLLTAIAASLGAPFWFDILNKVVNLRSAGRTPEQRGGKTVPATG